MRTDFKNDLGDLLIELRGKINILAHQTDRLFQLHNEYYPGMQEHGKSCSSCRSRVYKKMLILWDQSYSSDDK